MTRFLKWLIISLVALSVLLFGAYKYMQTQTKKHSPEETVSHDIAGGEIEIFYNRPFKKDREIFGNLVPYGQVWRTGANEATTFSTNVDLTVEGEQLAAGKYTFWTIPGESEWTLIWNGHMYSWGLRFWDGSAARQKEHDVLSVTVPAETIENVIEQFTIRISSSGELILEWDNTRVRAQLGTK